MTNVLTDSIKIEPGLRSSRRFHRYANQSFRYLAKRSTDIGIVFSDDKFKPNDNLVYKTAQFRFKYNIGKITWKRPKQLLEENNCNYPVSLIAENNTSCNVRHLFIGHSLNPWFVAAALAIAQHQILFEQLINIDENNFTENGIARFTIWQMGVLHKVVVDDRLPTLNSEPLFTKPLFWSCCGCSWWLPLLEKAYAKIYGSYEAMLTNGSIYSALIDLSGGGTIYKVDLNLHLEDIWPIIYKEFQSKSLLLLKTKEFNPEASAPFGLISNRYYLIKNLKKPIGTIKRIFTNSTLTNDNLPLLISNTIADGIKNSKFNKKTLQEFWIFSKNVPELFDLLIICRPYCFNKTNIHQLVVNKPNTENGLQFIFDVHLSNNNNNIDNLSKAVINLNLIQKTFSMTPIGFRIYFIELNRKFRVHNFSTLQLAASVHPIYSRNLIDTIYLPQGRYLLKPICPNITGLMVSIFSSQVQNLFQLTLDMPRHQLFSFMSPVYPSAVTRIKIIYVNCTEKQDRFGGANLYCIIRCRKKFVKSTVQSETLNPYWQNLSAIFYHRVNKVDPIWIEVWHRSILMDSLIGVVCYKPKILLHYEDESHITDNDNKENEIIEESDCDNLSDNVNKTDSDVSLKHLKKNDLAKNDLFRLPLTDKKNQTKHFGYVVFRAETVEDLKYF